ncbi:MAG: HAD family hydrolase [Lachnospiraceae bacterium]|nr:HAD family hydrolase [Lachnospiraceae bacterium]
MAEFILMDLDGTITNPKLGITKSFRYALKHWNIRIEDLDTLTRHIGPPLRDSFLEYGFSGDQLEQAIVKYREYFNKQGIFENEVYEGMEEFLRKLNRAGKKVIVATSKPEELARRILEHFYLAEYFADICGATFDESRAKKDEVIQYALDKNGITDYTKAVMVGDREYDIAGAKAIGIASVGVLYGFGSEEELRKAGAGRIAATVEELYNVLMD